MITIVATNLTDTITEKGMIEKIVPAYEPQTGTGSELPRGYSEIKVA